MSEGFILPDRPCIINVSGGRSSGAMLAAIHKVNNGIPDTAKAVFANTGKEREETLEFVRDMSDHWDIPITWLEFHYRHDSRGTKNDNTYWFKEVTFETASRNGSPFRKLCEVKNAIPDIQRRFCTQHLKVETIRKWAKATFGWKRPINIVGIRKDEPKRWRKIMNEDCDIRMPLALEGVTKEDVVEFWEAQDFDLKIPSTLSNCDLCFLKGNAMLRRIMKDEPERAKWWIDIEETYPTREGHTFRSNMSYRQLMDVDQKDLFDDYMSDCFCGD